jgi:hypothetical protein
MNFKTLFLLFITLFSVAGNGYGATQVGKNVMMITLGDAILHYKASVVEELLKGFPGLFEGEDTAERYLIDSDFRLPRII